MKEIFERRSVRAYTEEKVSGADMERLLRAAMQAPSAGNQQPWEFIVVEERQMLDTLSTKSPYAGMLKTAPACLVLVARSKGIRHPAFWEQDMSAATQNILLEAVHLNLGAVWLGVHPDMEREAEIRALFPAMPEDRRVFCMIAIGHPKAEGANRVLDRYDASRVHKEQY